MGEQIRTQLMATYQGVVDSVISWTPRILLAVLLLPITLSGDGTAMGQVQISLTYSLGVVMYQVLTGELEGERWRDTHLCIEGPAVTDLGAVFLESWFRADGPGLGWQAGLAHDLIAPHVDDLVQGFD